MNRDQFKGQWSQFKGELKKQWGKFTDDDLMQIEGDYDKFIGVMQERYGEHEEAVLHWVNYWYERHQTTKPGSPLEGWNRLSVRAMFDRQVWSHHSSQLNQQGGIVMKVVFIVAVLIAGLTGSSAWALFETNKELAKSATVTLDKAVQAAVAAMPGQAVEAELSKDEGRTVYKIEIIDINNKTQKVYVDAQTLETRVDKYK
jgi:uncharacterized protein YjbJ (UPF0337 family)